MATLEVRTIRNVSYVALSQVVVFLMGMITMILLARMLTPEDFGIVSLGMVFMILFSNLQDLGILPAIVQRDTKIRESISVGLALRWIVNGLLGLAILVLAPFISSFFGEPGIAYVILAFTLNLFILTLGFSSQIVLTRSLRFSVLSMASAVQYLVFAIISLLFAAGGFSYWSLVLGSISGSFAFVIYLGLYERPILRPRFDKVLANELFGYGKHLLVAGLMAFIIFNVDQLLVAKLLGISTLGFYFLAIRIGRNFGDQITGTVNKVLFPTMSRIKDDLERLRIGYDQSLRMISILASPACLGLMGISPILVHTLFGPEWLPVVIPLAILSCQGLIASFTAPAMNVLISLGKSRHMSLTATAQAILMVVAIYPVITFGGIIGLCLLTAIMSFGVLVYFLLVLSKNLKTSLLEVIRPIAPSLTSGLLMFFTIVLAVMIVPWTLEALGLIISLGAVEYLLVLNVISRGKEVRHAVSIVKKLFLRI